MRFEDGVEPDGHAVSLLGDLEVDLRYLLNAPTLGEGNKKRTTGMALLKYFPVHRSCPVTKLNTTDLRQ